jgi:hypothetical protein
MNISNYGLLNPTPSDPAGYITKDEMWAAVPFGKKFMILNNGEQVQVCQTLSTAKAYIQKQIKVSKKKTTSTLENFLK